MPSDDGFITSSPWHEGERVLQRLAGSAERLEAAGRNIFLDHLSPEEEYFYPQLPFVVVGTVDPAGDAWATLLAGRPGFLQVPDPSTLEIRAAEDPGDPARPGLREGDGVGLLGISLQTRIRMRLNGVVQRVDAETIRVAVAQSYGNCRQYIHLRDTFLARDPAAPAPAEAVELPAFDERASALVRNAATFFVASYVVDADGRRQVDVSHRGGKSGFVRLDDDGVLTIPDFSGNRYFNTLGNIYSNPRCGLVFVDFARGDLLHLTGDGEVILDSPEIAAFKGAQRLWRFRPRRLVYREGGVPLRWRLQENGVAPQVIRTGSWEEAASALAEAVPPSGND